MVDSEGGDSRIIHFPKSPVEPRMGKLISLPERKRRKSNPEDTLDGKILVRTEDFQSPTGLMAVAETIHAESAEMEQALKFKLLQEASVELADAVLGYEEADEKIHEDDRQLWLDRQKIEVRYLVELFEMRVGVAKKNQRVSVYGVTKNLNIYIDRALLLKGSKRDKFMSQTAEDRAYENLGIQKNTQEESTPKVIQEWAAHEKEYLEDAVDRRSKSHGRKNKSVVDSPPYTNARKPTATSVQTETGPQSHQ